MSDAKRRWLLIFFAAGHGTRQRFIDLGIALRQEITRESGHEPTPLATSATLDSYVYAVSTTRTAADFGSALMRHLHSSESERPVLFKLGDSPSSDKFFFVEVGEEKFFATSAVVKTLIGWERGRIPK
jgi:hypothetical protein